MKNIKKMLAVLLAGMMVVGMSSCDMIFGNEGNSSTGGPNNEQSSTIGGNENVNKTVKSIAMETQPTKIDFFVGEELTNASFEGATIKVTYEDGTDAVIPITAEGVEINASTRTPGTNRNVTVTYGRKRTTFKINVKAEGYEMTFDMNYAGSTAQKVNVTKGDKADAITPERAGHTFYNWYVDKECTVLYDFDTVLTGATTVYAQWKEEGATYYEFTYDLNYYGVATQQYTQIVKAGETARSLANPERSEYSFEGWHTDVPAVSDYTASAVNANTTVYAGWQKTKTGSSTYTFEAENTDLTGKVGPGYSGEAIEEGMIVPEATASGNKGVSYLYKKGISLEFYVASDADVDNIELVIYGRNEFSKAITLTKDTFQIKVSNNSADTSIANATVVDYQTVTLQPSTTVSAIITAKVSLKKGYNVIQLYVNNSVNPEGEGNGTFAGTAPVVDCIKLTTDAVLIWDGVKGLPANV